MNNEVNYNILKISEDPISEGRRPVSDSPGRGYQPANGRPNDLARNEVRSS